MSPGRSVYFILRYEKIEKQFFFLPQSIDENEAIIGLKISYFEVGWGSFLMSIIDVNRSLMGFWCHVYFPDMLNLMTQTSGKQLNETLHAVVIVRNEI